jgi:uncharacterized protein (DUF2267 family)
MLEENMRQLDAINDLVQQRIGLDQPDTAERLLQAVLETLAERDLSGAHASFAAELPPAYGQILNNPDRTSREEFSDEEFVRRVAERADIPLQQSKTWARAALSALVENVPALERERFVTALPDDLVGYTEWTF